MTTKLWAIGAILLCSLFTASGQLLFKLGAMRLPAILTNWPILAGFTSLGIGMILFVTAMRGGELNVIYPILATSYLWTNAFAMTVLNEQVGILKWSGVAIIIIGISFIGVGSRKND